MLVKLEARKPCGCAGLRLERPSHHRLDPTKAHSGRSDARKARRHGMQVRDYLLLTYPFDGLLQTRVPDRP